MMSHYLYSLVRCVPDPRTGEFVNVAAIAGNPETGDWALRQVGDSSRARKLAGSIAPTVLGAVNGFLAQVGGQIDSLQEAMLENSADLLTENWLGQLYHDHRNVVQLSVPTPILAENADEALEILFSSQIIDPVAEARERVVTKHRVMSDLLGAYRRAQIPPRLVRRRVELYVEDRVHASLDFAIANGTTVQITQGWSFQGAQADAVTEQVKAWAYALNRVRAGDSSRVIGVDNRSSEVGANVDLQVVVAAPRTAEQRQVYEEAEQVFAQINAQVHDLRDVDAVGSRAAELVGRGQFPYGAS